ncbi:Nucleotide-binding oligomerization domain-containing protein 2, partial [Hondaea fermentalgiana]
HGRKVDVIWSMPSNRGDVIFYPRHVRTDTWDATECNPWRAFVHLGVSCYDVRSLEDNIIGDEGATALANALASNESLQALNLQDTRIGVESATALANALAKNESLQELDLKRSNIGHEGATALANALVKNMSLQTLK